MEETAIEKVSKKSEWWVGITVAVLGLLTTVLSAVLPWLLSSPSPPTTATPVSAATQIVAAPQVVAAEGFGTFSARASLPNLTLGAWTIIASEDAEGVDFSNSTLRFTAQNATPQGLQLEGFFEWRGDGILLGREFFRADLDEATRQIFIQGLYIESAVSPPTLGVGSFSAKLSDDGRQLLEGTWGSTPGNLPGVAGTWSARR